MIAQGSKDMEYRMFVRGVNDVDAPGAWTALGTGYTAIADGNSATCLTDASVSGVTPANYHELEFAFVLRMESGGTLPNGRLRVAAALSYT